MKKLITLCMLLLCAVSSSWAESGTEKATNTGKKDTGITGTSYSIDGTYIAGAGGATAAGMANKGVKFRTGSDGARLVFTVNTGYTITDFKLYGVSNYDLKSGASEPCIAVTKVEVDEVETEQTGTGNFPAKGSSTAGSVLLSGISATQSIAIYFDNSNTAGTQINGYYEISWSLPEAQEPLSTTITPTSATIYEGQTVTLTGSFTGGDFEGEWLSDNEGVATVSNTGVVTGISAGTANITYQWKENQTKDAFKATAAITVKEPESVGAASSLALDIMQYETINLTNAYSFDEASRTLIVSANQIRANISTQKWMSYKDAGGAQKTWNASGVFKGSAFYNTGSSNNAVALRSGRTYTLAVTNCEEISALVLSGGSSKTTITIQMNIYEMDQYGLNRVSETPVTTKSTTSISEAILTAAGLDKSKVYQAVFTSTHASSNSYVYEVAFVSPDLRTATTLAFPEASYTANLGEAFTAPTLTTTPEGLSVTYESSNTDVAEVNATTGDVTVKTIGTTTITATFAGDETYANASASYLLTVVDPNIKQVTATFPFDTGKAGQVATVSADGVFSITSVGVADMTYAGVGSDQDITGTKMQPISSASDNKSQYTKFTLTPKKGITFIPKKVSFDAMRWGTDGSNKLHYYAECGNISEDLGNVNPNRNGKGLGWSHYEHNLSGIQSTSETPFSLACYVYGLANTKQISFANVVIEGEYSGEAEEETMYAIITSVTPEGAGSVVQNPAGASLTEGTAVEFSATPNTGYKFLDKWTVNGAEINGATYSVASLSEDLEIVAHFKKLYTVNFSAGEGDKGTSNPLPTVYSESTYTTPVANYYISKAGYTTTGWTDGENNYGFGEEITLTGDITLTPVFVANTKTITDTRISDITITYGFDNTKNDPSINLENSTGYYVKQVIFDGEPLDVPMFIDNRDNAGVEGKRGKTNNVGRATAQINAGTKFTLPAVSGMTIKLNVGSGDLEATVAGDTYTDNYKYIGGADSIDIIFIQSEGSVYLNSVVVTYPKTHTYVDVTAVGYRTFASSSALDFTKGVEGLTAYRATILNDKVSFTTINSAVPAGEGMLLKAEADRYYIPVAEGTPDDIENELVGVTTATEIAAPIFVLMNETKGLGFYKTTQAFTVGANTAYLPASVAQGRSFISLFDDEVTGIKASTIGTTDSDPIYNLQGQRVAAAKKGLYIVNGKKVIK